MAKQLTGIVNASIMVGETLGMYSQTLADGQMMTSIATDPKYIEAAMRYPYDAGIATEVLRFTPAILLPFVAHLDIRRRHIN